MALVTSQRIRKEIPHESGEWIEFRPLKVAEAGGLTADADGGVVMLTRCIVGWSYDAPCDAENIATLDIGTATWALGVISEVSHLSEAVGEPSAAV